MDVFSAYASTHSGLPLSWQLHHISLTRLRTRTSGLHRSCLRSAGNCSRIIRMSFLQAVLSIHELTKRTHRFKKIQSCGQLNLHLRPAYLESAIPSSSEQRASSLTRLVDAMSRTGIQTLFMSMPIFYKLRLRGWQWVNPAELFLYTCWKNVSSLSLFLWL